MSKPWQHALKTALKGTQLEDIKKTDIFHESGHLLFPTVITESQLTQADLDNPLDPIALQYIPQPSEQQLHPGFKTDPVGDIDASQSPGLIHKYKGRVLLIASGTCAVNCRYCFRRHFEYSNNFAPRNNWKEAVDYIKQDTSIHEVILSGGDPLTIQTKTIKALSDQLLALPHIKTLRIHSRIPVVLPERIDSDFINYIKTLTLNKVLVLHINHSQELSQEARCAIRDLKSANVTLLNQSVILKSVNDQAKTLIDLSHKLHDLGVIPYYLHVMDKVQNASHFDVPLALAKNLHQQLQEALPGYLVPKLTAEIKGQKSKTWINNP
ncbi:EF-P beta-lysylation protein EpmB [Marinicella rhabdoformis]|uniref:EF-P beta-lysylation protein EpmB n=1 Tax=Marinicella rhabdoformis TaxID=2580566 RepID=UPI0012AED603|nr:EF-P beta-lysylation protein EpmB [Marinicella rhabdoformis]